VSFSVIKLTGWLSRCGYIVCTKLQPTAAVAARRLGLYAMNFVAATVFDGFFQQIDSGDYSDNPSPRFATKND